MVQFTDGDDQEKLSKVLFSAIDEDSVEDNKENQQPIDDRRPSQRAAKLPRNQNVADNRESFRNDKVFYNNDVTICNNNEIAAEARDESSTTNANIDYDDDDGTSLSFTPISNTTVLSMTHASDVTTALQSFNSAVVSSINVHSLIESATANSNKQAREALEQRSKSNSQSITNNYTDGGLLLISQLDSQNNKLCPVSGSQVYMGNGKFYTSLQNSVVAKNNEKLWHHGTGMSATSSLWNRPNITPKDNSKSNHDREQAHSNQNHAGAKTGVSSSGDVTHAIRNYYNEDVESIKVRQVTELHPREITLTDTMAMHTEEVEEDQQDNSDKSKSKTQTSGKKESVEKFVGRVKRNKKRQSITELNETISESQVHFQNLQSEISTLLDSQRLEPTSENVDDNGNENVSSGSESASRSRNANIMYQLNLIQKQQDQLQLLQRQLQEQLQKELKQEKHLTFTQETSATSSDMQQQGMMGNMESVPDNCVQQNLPGQSFCRENTNNGNSVNNSITTSNQQRVDVGVGGDKHVSGTKRDELCENVEEEECNNNGTTAVNLNTVKQEVTDDSSVRTIQALDLSSVVPITDKSVQKDSVERSVSTPPSKIGHFPFIHEHLELTPTSISRSHNISGYLSSATTMFCHTLTQSQNGTPAKSNRTPLVDVSSAMTSKQQTCSLLTPVTTVQSNMGPLVSPKVIKLEPSCQTKLSANIFVSSSSVPPLWTPLALKVAADSQPESSLSVDLPRQTAVSSEKVEEHPLAAVSPNENVVLDLSGSVTVTNVISSGTNISVGNDCSRFQSPVQSSQSAFRSVSGSNSSHSGSLSLRANITPLDLSAKKQKEKSTPLRKIVLLVTSERYQEALLDDECALYACRLQSFTRLPASRDLINPVARMLSEGDDMHFVPITDETNRHHYGFREGSAFHCYSP